MRRNRCRRGVSPNLSDLKPARGRKTIGGGYGGGIQVHKNVTGLARRHGAQEGDRDDDRADPAKSNLHFSPQELLCSVGVFATSKFTGRKVSIHRSLVVIVDSIRRKLWTSMKMPQMPTGKNRPTPCWRQSDSTSSGAMSLIAISQATTTSKKLTQRSQNNLETILLR